MTTAKEHAPEVWPWRMVDGPVLHADRFYGFCDSGGLCGARVGYESQQRAEEFIGDGFGIADISTKPEDLGGVACCILTGRQYVDRLYALCLPGGSGWELSDYGHWSAPEKHALPPTPEGPPAPWFAAGSLATQMNAAALRTLTGLGYIWEGGEQWKPPLGAKPYTEQVDPARWADARALAKRVNELLYAKGAPLGSDAYFAIRELLAAELKAELAEREVAALKGANATLSPAQEAQIHDALKAVLSKRDQGRVMGILREVLGHGL